MKPPKPIHQFTSTGEFITTFTSSKEAETMLNLPERTATRSAYRGDKIEGKWIFSYSKDWKPTDPKPIRRDRVKIHTTKQVTQEIEKKEPCKLNDVFLLGCF